MSGYELATMKLAPFIRDTFGAVQVVTDTRQVVLDVQGRHYDTTAQVYRDHGWVRLSVEQARRLQTLLIEQAHEAPIAAAQGRLWALPTSRWAA